MALLAKAQNTIGLSQRELGDLLGVARVTVSRWYSRGGTTLTPSQLATLAKASLPHDPKLAAAFAEQAGQTLVSLGLVPAPPPPPPPPAPRPHPLVVDSVVCAAADALQQPPAALRPILLAAFERAHVMGLGVAEVIAGLKQASK